MRLTTAQLESMRRIDIAAIDKDALVDVSGMTFDNTLPKEQRAANMLAVMKNPYCFRHGDMVIKLEFAPSSFSTSGQSVSKSVFRMGGAELFFLSCHKTAIFGTTPPHNG